MKKALALSFVACSVLGASAFAADNLFEITPQIGGSWHISNDRYSNDIDLSYGLKFANRLTRNVLVEFSYERIDDADYSLFNESTDVSRYAMNLVREFYVENTISPYILGGFGYEHMSNNLQSMDSDLFGQYGVGVRYALAEFFHLKAEVRHLLSFDGRSDIIGMVGFSIPFGTYTDPVAVAEKGTQSQLQQQKGAGVGAGAPSHIHTFSVQFPFDSSEIRPTYNAEIRDFAESMKQNPNQTAVISGHTDSVGGNGAYNQRLSERRANAVKNAIVNQGVEENRLEAKGYGSTRPIADNATNEGRRQNRRVEAEIYTNPTQE